MGRAKKAAAPVEVDYFEFDAPLDLGRPPGWPPARVLTVHDMTWNFTTDDGRMDLKERLDDTFLEAGQWRSAYALLITILSERYGRAVRALWTFLEYGSRHRYPPLTWQAACWNEMLHQLGYRVSDDQRADPGLPRQE